MTMAGQNGDLSAVHRKQRTKKQHKRHDTDNQHVVRMQIDANRGQNVEGSEVAGHHRLSSRRATLPCELSGGLQVLSR